MHRSLLSLLIPIFAFSLIGGSSTFAQDQPEPPSHRLVPVEEVAAEESEGKIWESVETVYARLYRQVRVIGVDERGVTFRHAHGIAKLPFAQFSGEFRAQFNKQEQQWEEERQAEGKARLEAMKQGAPGSSACPPAASTVIIILGQRRATPSPSPCRFGYAYQQTYPRTANLPCNLASWRENSKRQLLAVSQAVRLRPFGANARFIVPVRYRY